ncbi:AAA-like domain-containing protein [PVC group bacterium]|nr:AAA-like domain-containing protein [PVC group bacterium]
MKFFNTEGPVNKESHYKIDPLSRWDMDEILTLIAREKYFILHAPRQTGKTSCLLALRDYLNKEERYYCVYANFEAAQTARNDISEGIKSILSELHQRAIGALKIKIPFTVNEIIEKNGANKAMGTYLSALCELLDKPLILLIDEIDSLIGDTLVSVLRQLRASYDTRPDAFPQSVILCGVRDIKDYRIHKSDDDIITGGSCFNIKAKSLTLGNFSDDEVKTLYAEHTKETGQIFEPDCFPLIMRYTGGQPWLVNALGYEVTYEMKPNRDPSVVIAPEMIETAKERLILSRATHLDQLSDKLQEDRVRRVIEPMIVGEEDNSTKDDNQYCIDLGLVKLSPQGLIISNEIYMEIIPRELTEIRQTRFLSRFTPEWVKQDESLDTEKLFTMFQEFWRENSEIWKKDMAGYREAAPHLTFQAFLQRVANGKGFIGREFAYGTKRSDLVLKWKYPAGEPDRNPAGTGKQAGEQRIVIELKMLKEKDSYDAIKTKALEQTAMYADKCNATEAHIIIFDRCRKTDWKEKIFTDTGERNGYHIKIWGM